MESNSLRGHMAFLISLTTCIILGGTINMKPISLISTINLTGSTKDHGSNARRLVNYNWIGTWL